jgi:hypothetical protein
LIGFLHSGSPLEIEFATRTLSEFGSRAAASSFRFQLKAGQLPFQPHEYFQRSTAFHFFVELRQQGRLVHFK